MALFGRGGELDSLRTAQPVCLIAGDAGAGKSALLRAAQASAGPLAPEPIQLAERPGSLQQSLLEAMAAAVDRLHSEEGPVARAQRLAASTAKHLVDRRLSALTDAAGRILVSYVAAHVGQAAVDAIAEVTAAARASEAQELEHRITSVGDTDVMTVIASMLKELADLAAPSRVALALDDLHQLTDDDQRRFRDLCGEVAGAVDVRATFTVTTAHDQAALDQFAAKGAQVLRIAGLSAGDVQAWVESAGTDPARSGEVERITGGLPLYVGDAIALLAFDLPLEGLSGNKVLVARTRAAWGALSGPDHDYAVVLACLHSQPSPARAASLLGLDDLAWHNLVSRLTASGVFLSETGWFHQLRRACINQTLLTEPQRTAAEHRIVDQAVEYLRGEDEDSPEVLEAIQALGDHQGAAAVALGTASGVERVADCTEDELRVLAGIVEIYVPESEGDAVPITVLDRYLRQTGPPTDLAAAITGLDGDLIETEADRSRGLVIAPSFPSAESRWLFLGRCAVALDRFPVPSAATSMYRSVLHPLIEPFHQTVYGVGDVPLAELADIARQIQATPRNGVTTFSPRWPSLAVRARVGALPVYGVVAYNQPANRDRHLAQVEGHESTVLGTPCEITEAWAIPTDRLPLYRFSSVFEALCPPTDPAPSPASAEEAAALHKAAHDFLRRHTTELERDALDIREPIGVVYYSDDESWAQVEIVGAESISRTADPTAVWPQDTDGWLRRGERLGLVGAQRVGRVRIHTALPEDPIRDELHRRSGFAATYNKANMRVNIRYDLERLLPLLEDAHASRRVLAERMCSELLDRPAPGPTTTFVVMDIGEPEGNWVPGVRDRTVVLEVPSVDAESRLHVRVGKPVVWMPFDEVGFVEDHFGDVPEDVEGGRLLVTDAAHWIASYLGYEYDDLWLAYKWTIPPPGVDQPVEWDLEN